MAATRTFGRVTSSVPADAAAMKITGFELRHCRVPVHTRVRESLVGSFQRQGRYQDHFESVLVFLNTDVGLTGLGEALMPLERAKGILSEMIGHSPWEYILEDDIHGILIAIYDLIGQAAGLPIARLISPSPRPRIVQTWWSQCYPPDQMASEARLGAELGYRVHKVKARPWEDPIEQAEAICEAVPRDFRIWADANGWWGSVERTLFLTRSLAEFPNYFAIESPFPRQRIEAFRQLKNRVPLILSEHIESLDAMLFIREGLVDTFVVGAPRLGLTMMRHDAMARYFGHPLWIEHSIVTGIAQVFQAHQAAALPGVEYCISITHCLEDDLMKEPFRMEDGFYTVPTMPGLGVSIDEAAVDKYRIA